MPTRAKIVLWDSDGNAALARIAGYRAVASIVAALLGKKGTRMLVIVAALLIEFSMFAAVKERG